MLMWVCWSSVHQKHALRFKSLNQIRTWVSCGITTLLKGLFFSPVWNKNSFVILETCLWDWKDFSCACCLCFYISQRSCNIALVLSWSLLFWAAKHNKISVALFPAGSERPCLQHWNKWCVKNGRLMGSWLALLGHAACEGLYLHEPLLGEAVSIVGRDSDDLGFSESSGSRTWFSESSGSESPGSRTRPSESDLCHKAVLYNDHGFACHHIQMKHY